MEAMHGDSLINAVFPLLDDATKGKSERLDTVETGLRHRGLDKFVKRDFTVVRGLAYYTGVVFEAFDRTGEFRAIAGGGRYDTLLKNLGGVDLPALGFGIGDMVLGEILKARPRPEHPGKKGWSAYVAVADEAFRPQAMKLLQELRSRVQFPIIYSLQPARLGKQLQQAEEQGCDFALIIDKEIANGIVGLKDLASREQKQMAIGDYHGLLRECQELWVAKISAWVEANNVEARKAIRSASPPSS